MYKRFEQWWNGSRYATMLPDDPLKGAFKEVAFEAWKNALMPPKPPIEIKGELIFIDQYRKEKASLLLSNGGPEVA